MFGTLMKISIGFSLMCGTVLIVYHEWNGDYSRKKRAEDPSFVPFVDWPNGLGELLFFTVLFLVGGALLVYGILEITRK